MSQAYTTIYLIRHGEVNNPDRIIYGRAVDVPLHDTGFTQILVLAKRLKEQGIKPDVIYTSPLRRAVQSARSLAEVYVHVPVIVAKDLQDADHQGLEHKTLDWLASIGGDVYGLPEFQGTIEPPHSMAQRVIHVLKTTRATYKGKTIFVVSHGDPIAFTRWQLLHPLDDLPSMAELGKTGYLKKAEAWRVVFDLAGNVIDHGIISRDEEAVKGKREY